MSTDNIFPERFLGWELGLEYVLNGRDPYHHTPDTREGKAERILRGVAFVQRFPNIEADREKLSEIYAGYWGLDGSIDSCLQVGWVKLRPFLQFLTAGSDYSRQVKAELLERGWKIRGDGRITRIAKREGRDIVTWSILRAYREVHPEQCSNKQEMWPQIRSKLSLWFDAEELSDSKINNTINNFLRVKK